MSSDKRFLLSRVPIGCGTALDLGGGAGELRLPLEQRGFTYVNLDVASPLEKRAVAGDASCLPFASGSIDLVVSSDTLEHFAQPAHALCEVRRVLTPNGRLVVWVPFLHPFHSTDYFRFTPLGLRMLFSNARLEIDTLEAPLSIFSLFAQVLVAALQRVGIRRPEPAIERGAAWLDARSRVLRGHSLAFATAYLVVARCGGVGGDRER